MDRKWEGKNAIICDDSKKAREELKSIFDKAGLNVIGLASTGFQVIEMVEKHNPDLVSLDIIMPEMNGMECYKKLQQLNVQAEIVFISALATENRIVSHYQSEIEPERFISKPLTQTILEERLAKIFGNDTSS